MHQRYLIAFALFLAPAAMIVGANALYLRNVGEFLTLPEVIAIQQSDPGYCIYGTALHDDTFTYKLEGYRARTPEISIVGSSVTTQLRERDFTAPFYSMSSTMDSIVNGRHVTELMNEIHRPRVLLLGLDFWWFSSGVNPYKSAHPPLERDRFTLEKIFRPFQWLMTGKVAPAEYVRVLLGRKDPDAKCAIGVYSREHRRGFAPDGSYYYTSRITGQETENFAPGFANELRDIEQGTGHFQHGDAINERIVQDLIAMIHSLEGQGIAVIPFLHPVAPTVHAAMQRSGRYAYIPKVAQTLQNAGIRVLNFHDPRSVGTSDCEFIDGLHGGDVTYARVLWEIHSSLADPSLRSLFNIAVLDRMIADDAGYAMARDTRVTEEAETDFHEIGCAK